MKIEWSVSGEGVHSAVWSGARRVVHATVEPLSEVGWDWHVWDASHGGQQVYGMCDTLDGAKQKAERAMGAMMRELGV